MNLKDRYYRLSFWSKMGFWGSLASIIAIIIAIVFWVYERQSENRRNQEYLPSREAVVSAIFQSYQSLNRAAELVIAPDGISDSVPISPRQKALICKWSLDPVEYDLKKVEKTVIRNNVALDPQTMGLVSAFIDDARSLQKRLTFFAQLHNPEFSNWDFVSTGPFAKFSRLENIFNELKIRYPQIDIENNLKSAKELERIWKETEKNNDRLCLRVGQYKWNPDRLPMVFDRNDLVQLDLPISAKTYVYDLNE